MVFSLEKSYTASIAEIGENARGFAWQFLTQLPGGVMTPPYVAFENFEKED